MLFTCRVCSEDGFNNVSSQIISQAIAAIRLRSNVCLQSTKIRSVNLQQYVVNVDLVNA